MNEHGACQQRVKGQNAKKNKSITIQGAGNNEVVVASGDERILFDNVESVRNYSATQRQQFKMDQNRAQHDANLQRNVLINKSISMNQIQPQLERKSSTDLGHNGMFADSTIQGQYPDHQNTGSQSIIGMGNQQNHQQINVVPLGQPAKVLA